MEDIYENTNTRSDIPQVKYVQVRREVSDTIKEQVFKWLQKTHCYFDQVSSINESHPVLLKHWGSWTAGEYIYRILVKQDLTYGYTPNEGEIL